MSNKTTVSRWLADDFHVTRAWAPPVRCLHLYTISMYYCHVMFYRLCVLLVLLPFYLSACRCLYVVGGGRVCLAAVARGRCAGYESVVACITTPYPPHTRTHMQTHLFYYTLQYTHSDIIYTYPTSHPSIYNSISVYLSIYIYKHTKAELDRKHLLSYIKWACCVLNWIMSPGSIWWNRWVFEYRRWGSGTWKRHQTYVYRTPCHTAEWRRWQNNIRM